MMKSRIAMRKISTDTLPSNRPSAVGNLDLLKSEDFTKGDRQKEAPVSERDQVDNKNYEMIEEIVVSEGIPALPIKKKHVINKLNFMNFQDQAITIHFKNRENRAIICAFSAIPSPCRQDRFSCTWCNPDEICQITGTHFLSHIEIQTDNTHLTAEPDLVSFNKSSIELDLNEKCFQWPITRGVVPVRPGLKIRLMQNNTVFEGVLREFSVEKLSIQIYFTLPQAPLWIDKSRGVNLMVFDDTGNLYTGECNVLELSSRTTTADLSLAPCLHQVPRFKPTKYRSIRQPLFPAPDINFIHPLTGKPVTLKTIDLSGSGICVEDHPERPVLLPGMVIPELCIDLLHGSSIVCQAQVVYSDKISDMENGHIHAGIALLDIHFRDFIQLSSLLHQAEDANSYVCRQIDTDALWEFFFDTGFIYPGKYEHFQEKKKEIKEVYEKLYTNSPLIAGHFTYQDKGTILGHMSMLRLYDRSWMIHHHAARKTCQVKAGVAVLKQIGRFGYEAHRFRSSHMDYLFCYYRPDNLFPAFVFGGALTAINHPQQCSEDAFAYLHVDGAKQPTPIGKPWALEDANLDDFSTLEEHYKQVSGGMMIQALDLYPEFEERTCLEQEYERYGFSKTKTVLALKKSGRLKAVVLVNKTNTGLNLSDLTNCIKMIVVDSNGLHRDIVMAVARSIAATFPAGEVPLLVHPVDYAESAGLSIEKKYNLWIMKIKYSDKYFAHIDTIFKNLLEQGR